MDGNKFCFTAPAQVVNGVGRQLLARAAFALEQNIGGGGRDLADGVEDFAQYRRFSDDVLESVAFVDLLTQGTVFLLQLPASQSARDQHFNLVEIERLSNEVVGAAFHRFDRDVDRAI